MTPVNVLSLSLTHTHARARAQPPIPPHPPPLHTTHITKYYTKTIKDWCVKGGSKGEVPAASADYNILYTVTVCESQAEVTGKVTAASADYESHRLVCELKPGRSDRGAFNSV